MMNSPSARHFLAAALCCLPMACSSVDLPAWAKRTPVPKATPIRFPKANVSDGTKTKPKQVGTILLVNAEAGFVLIETHGWVPPEAGQALKCIHQGVDTGIVAVGRERQGSHVVADIVTGTPKKGDQVFQ